MAVLHWTRLNRYNFGLFNFSLFLPLFARFNRWLLTRRRSGFYLRLFNWHAAVFGGFFRFFWHWTRFSVDGEFCDAPVVVVELLTSFFSCNEMQLTIAAMGYLFWPNLAIHFFSRSTSFFPRKLTKQAAIVNGIPFQLKKTTSKSSNFKNWRPFEFFDNN